ncbi:MAG: hypothetical protein LQ351_001169 [Letrouitia transgressa]|nr:MAG: hypothetical protein LQ351_001169 [Letrouitia transgressa]
MSAFSPYTDSPTSPAPLKSPNRSSNSSDNSNFLHPPGPPSPLASSPSDIVDPSPIAPSSNGTDFEDTVIEQEEVEHLEPLREEPREDLDSTPSLRQGESGLKLDTASAPKNNIRPSSDEDEQPNSVIHAPQSFEAFESPTPISTTVPPARDWSATPRAQTRPEADAEAHEPDRGKGRASSLEADIPEALDCDQSADLSDGQNIDQPNASLEDAIGILQETTDEIAALKLALSECWTLCNTLAGLSYIHRERSFSHAGAGDAQSQAWKSCWKLCQKLYETRDEDYATQVRPTLDLCRDFCQCLFEVRQRENEVADSVLRVSFELNNHLYNTHDRTLPEAFRERTLDFYITLCHRLMKQRFRVAEETDSLLRACWSLAEMLFSLRQNKLEGKPADEELLGSAVQACWELCDLFREGWTQVRPDRGTPRPSQTTFTQAFQQAKQSSLSSRATPTPSHSSAYSYGREESESESEGGFGRLNPETPTTIFEDTQQISPDEASVPNILVLGPDTRTQQRQAQIAQQQQQQQQQRGPIPMHQKWNSSSSTLSGYSGSSTSTIINPNPNSSPSARAAAGGGGGGGSSSSSVKGSKADDPHLLSLKLLILKAALNTGYHPTSNQRISLAQYVKPLPSNAFGNAPWQLQLLDQYKKLVGGDPGVGRLAAIGGGGKARVRLGDVVKAVRWMVAGGQFAWLEDLFKLVVGWGVDEGDGREGWLSV